MGYSRRKRRDPLRGFKVLIASCAAFFLAWRIDLVFGAICEVAKQASCTQQPARQLVWIPLAMGVLLLLQGVCRLYRDYWKGEIYRNSGKDEWFR
jgi:hypothetical protein